jgi:hypothetical protein
MPPTLSPHGKNNIHHNNKKKNDDNFRGFSDEGHENNIKLLSLDVPHYSQCVYCSVKL